MSPAIKRPHYYSRTPESEHRRITSRLLRLNRVQRFHIRVVFLGIIHVACPFCGHMIRRRLMQRRYWFMCQVCEAKFVPKLTLLQVPPGGRRDIPPDFILPNLTGEDALLEAFPAGDMELWVQRGCTHQLQVVSFDRVPDDLKTHVVQAMDDSPEVVVPGSGRRRGITGVNATRRGPNKKKPKEKTE
jgi:hypothetical protein